MRNSLSGLPCPIVVVPESARFIATGRHELEILLVCHLVPIDLECRNFHRVSFVFVVPTELFGVAIETHRHATRWDGNTAVDDWPTGEIRCIEIRHLHVTW